MKLSTRLDRIVANYKKHEVSETSRPAAPNTSTFTAMVGGMIERSDNLTSPGGYYGFARTFETGIKVGSGIPYSIRNLIIAEVKAAVEKDGGTFDSVEGTYWCFYGKRAAS